MQVEMDIVLLTMFEKYCKVHFKNHVKIVLNNNEKIEPQHTGNIAVSMRLTEAPAQTTLYASNYPEGNGSYICAAQRTFIGVLVGCGGFGFGVCLPSCARCVCRRGCPVLG